MSFFVAENITRRFYGFNALDNVMFSMERAERRAVIGPNGAGKSTLFNILGGQMAPSSGTIRFDGREITALPAHTRARLGITRTFQRNNLFKGLTVFENIRLAVQAHRKAGFDALHHYSTHRDIWDRACEVLERFALAEHGARPAKELSYGDERKLEIAIAVAGDPVVLLVDEPTAGMSASETTEMVRILAALPQNIGLIIVEHDMDVVSALAHQVTVLQNGRLIASGSWDDIRCDETVQRAYIGSRRKGM